MDTPIPVAAPAAPLSPGTAADAQAQIDELMRTPEYQRADRATVDEVQRLFQVKAHGPGAGGDPMLGLGSGPEYRVAIPPGQTPESFSPLLQEGAAAACHAVGLTESQANAGLAYLLDARAADPVLPRDLKIPTREAAQSQLESRWAEHFPRQMALAEAALIELDEQRGGVKGALVERFKAHRLQNSPDVIRELSVLGGQYLVAQRPGFADLVEYFEADWRTRSPGRRR